MIIEHRIQNESFNVDVGSPCASDDVAKLGNVDQIAVAFHAMKDQRGRAKVEPLGQGRRRNRHLEHAIAQQAFDFFSIRCRQGTVVYRHSQLQALQDVMVWPEPLGTDG